MVFSVHIEAEQERQATVRQSSSVKMSVAEVIRSEGEAEAAKMISEALKEHGSGLIEAMGSAVCGSHMRFIQLIYYII